MKKTSFIFVLFCLLTSNAFAQKWNPERDNRQELAVAQVILKAEEYNPELAEWFDTAYAYAVFPKVGKGGMGIGGAYGKGIVISNGVTVGKTSLSQLTFGFQLGGQIYSEYIFFKDSAAFGNFSRGNFEMGAQVSAVALTLGASFDASYDKGVAVFTLAEGGLMYEATIGGQKFTYRPLN